MDESKKENQIEGKVPTTCAIIRRERDGKEEVLLVKRAKSKSHAGEWALPSGRGFSKRKYNLSSDQAVIKEVEADLGTQSFKGKRLFSRPVIGNDKTNEIIVYVGEVNESELRVMPGEMEEFRWVTLKEASLESLAFKGGETLKDYLNLKK